MTDPTLGVSQTRAQPEQEAWEAAFEQWEADQRASGIADATIKQRRKYVRRLARAVDCHPFELPQARVNLWLESLTMADASRRSHQSAVRAFYRWAAETGRSFSDPTLVHHFGPAPRAVPDSWLDPLHQFTSHLRAGGRSETTVTTFLDVLRHFARQNPHLAPLVVQTEDITRWMGNKRWARETRRRNRQTLMSFY